MTIPAFFVRRSAGALLVVITLGVAACSSGGATPSPTTAAVAPPSSAASAGAAASASAEASASEEASGEEYRIEVATSPTLGKYLTGEDGKTLYTFKKDTTPNQSVCTGDCASKWPPFTLDEDEKAEAGDGVTGKIATFDRPDGKKQVSYNGQPLYYFSGDAKAGDTNGQGVLNIWFVATP